MSGSVSVPGPGGSTITQTFSNTFNNALAKSIADALANAASHNDLFIQTVTGSVSAPVNNSGLIGELVIIPGSTGDVTVPAGANYSFVIDDSTGPDTIHGSTNLSIMGGAGVHTIIDPAIITLSDNAIGNVTLTNAGDTVAAGDGAATVNATGNNDGVLGGGGKLTASVSGTGSEVVGGTGALTAVVSGTFDTIFGGAGATAVTLSGSSNVVVGNVAGLSVLDNGTGDTIDAGVSFTTVTAPGGAFVRGGSGPLNFVGGTGPSTIVGGSGGATVFGGIGFTSIVGSAGGATTYVNTTSGGLTYVAGAGNETVDASLAKTGNWLQGGTGQNLLIGGAGADGLAAGSGIGTLVGGGGANVFYFFKAQGGPAAQDVISDFSAIDHVALVNYSPGEPAAAIAGATTSGGSTTITLSDNTKITFTGVTNVASIADRISSI
jgi:Ca2+-binding RTX toxin-like protein